MTSSTGRKKQTKKASHINLPIWTGGKRLYPGTSNLLLWYYSPGDELLDSHFSSQTCTSFISEHINVNFKNAEWHSSSSILTSQYIK